MIASNTRLNNMWFNNSGISNHMRSYSEWFQLLWTPKRIDYMEPSIDNMHPICHIRDVSISNNGEHHKCIKNIFYVSNISKSLASVQYSCVLHQRPKEKDTIGRSQKNRRPIPNSHNFGEYFITVGDSIAC